MSTTPVALVTGASGDIGGAIAKTLGRHGWHVIGTYVGAADAAAQTVAAIIDVGGSAEAVQLDQRDPAAIEAVIANIDERYGRLGARAGVEAGAGAGQLFSRSASRPVAGQQSVRFQTPRIPNSWRPKLNLQTDNNVN